MLPREAAKIAEAKTPKTATCSVCGRVGSVTRNGRRMRPHLRKIVHREADENGPEVTTTGDCRGSRRAPIEYAEAFRAARQQED